jgi:hypothetical protein
MSLASWHRLGGGGLIRLSAPNWLICARTSTYDQARSTTRNRYARFVVVSAYRTLMIDTGWIRRVRGRRGVSG